MTSSSLDEVIKNKLVFVLLDLTKLTSFEVSFMPIRSNSRQNLMVHRVRISLQDIQNVSEFVYRLLLHHNYRG